MGKVDLDLFKPELVYFDFEAADRVEFFKKLGEDLAKQGYIKDSWYDGITTREKNYPTGLPFETVPVALPHVDPEHLNKPYIAVVKPKTPIVFEGMAGMGGEVHAELIVNLGLTEHAEGQVAVLQSLMNVFLNADAVNEIMAQTTPDGMVATMRKYCAE